MEIGELVVGGIGLLTTVASGWTSWFFTRKKYNSEVASNYIDNLGKGLLTYDAIIAHNKSEIEYLMKENEELRKEIAELRNQLLNLTMNICMDLTCMNRVRERNILNNKKKNAKGSGRLDETKDFS